MKEPHRSPPTNFRWLRPPPTPPHPLRPHHSTPHHRPLPPPPPAPPPPNPPKPPPPPNPPPPDPPPHPPPREPPPPPLSRRPQSSIRPKGVNKAIKTRMTIPTMAPTGRPRVGPSSGSAGAWGSVPVRAIPASFAITSATRAVSREAARL